MRVRSDLEHELPPPHPLSGNGPVRMHSRRWLPSCVPIVPPVYCSTLLAWEAPIARLQIRKRTYNFALGAEGEQP